MIPSQPSFNTVTPETIVGSSSHAALTQNYFEIWRKFIYNSTGIYFQDNKKYLLESRLRKRYAFLGLKSFEEYYHFVNNSNSGSAELKYLFEAITINETFFFRNQPQFDALISSILPELIEAKDKIGKNKIRIWSAASSTGEEAYTISMLISELIKPKFPKFDFEIVGTDISTGAVETAKKGIYKEYSIRNMPVYYLKKYFKLGPSGYELDPKIKSMASFKLLNLYDDFSMRTMINFDVIFCANVLIYFDQNSKIKVVNHLYNSLLKGGHLFIGYSETLHGISKAFKLVSFPKTVSYKRE
ncbi:MAG: protein-glutamate O-methyltransferase CheR [Ignavibacteriaceae bacterium]|nr:protein-glutamate O-methyltransferase CheR [Ignavibacteriaceae bacterium]